MLNNLKLLVVVLQNTSNSFLTRSFGNPPSKNGPLRSRKRVQGFKNDPHCSVRPRIPSGVLSCVIFAHLYFGLMNGLSAKASLTSQSSKDKVADPSLYRMDTEWKLPSEKSVESPLETLVIL